MIASRYFTHLLLWQPWRAQQNFSVTALLMQALNAPTKVGGKMDFALNYELNLYRSGLPPSEGMDFGHDDGNLAAFRRGAQRRHITCREIAPPGQWAVRSLPRTRPVAEGHANATASLNFGHMSMMASNKPSAQ